MTGSPRPSIRRLARPLARKRSPLQPRPLLLLLFLVLATTGCSDEERSREEASGGDPARWVDPFIGSEGEGNVVPGPCLPHGMVKLSPDTDAPEGSIDAYEYADDRIEGFSHTHIEGPGGSRNGYSHILLMPTTGDVAVSEQAYASSFSHERESASPGYYRVRLDDYGVEAELTATARAGFHRYTFPASDRSNILIDVGHTRGQSLGGHVEVVGDRVVRGYGVYSMHPLVALATQDAPGTTGEMRVFFHAELDRPFSFHGVWERGSPRPGARTAEGPDIGAWVGFETSEGDVIRAKVGISFIDLEQAAENLDREIPGWDFDGVRDRARREWNELLGRIRVSGGSASQRTQFYTALYHALLQPADDAEYGRYWSGSDGTGAVFASGGRRFFVDDWCVWDTFRTTHPLQALVEPETRSDVVRSYLSLYEQGGWLPKCTWQATGYSRVMIGNHAASVILDAFRKGFRDFDVDTAYEAMRRSALEDNENVLSDLLCGYLNLGTPPEYISLGFVPQQCDPTQSVSMTLEYAYDDACLARMAQELGREADHALFLERSRSYARHWNPASGFMQPLSRSGRWIFPFDPTAGDGFCEADAWKYTWFVPHDPHGLIGLMGGREAFVAKLDAFFEGGHYDPANEPDFHAPYLYVYAGAPHRTQLRVRQLMESAFGSHPEGLPGNDDSGATSAWYVLSAMGLYPVCPGDAVYVLGSPVFDRVEIRLRPGYHPGRRFVIEARDNSPTNIYIQSAELNGERLDRAWLRHEEIVRGGTLVMRMGPEPSAWGADPAMAPPSLAGKLHETSSRVRRKGR